MSLPRFGVNKPVPVNLLMIGMIVAGIYAGATLRREFFPETDPEAALVSLPYPGATPEEVEETLARKVEDALIDVKEVDEVRATLTEGGGGVTVDFKEGIDSDKAMDEVERAIDSLLDLPEEAETIQVSLLEPTLPVIRVALYGDLDEEVRKRAIRGIRDDLRLLDGMGEIIVDGVRDYEIRVDVDADALIRHGISLPQVSQTIGEWMRDVPGGTVRGGEANVRIRTMGVEEQAKAIRDIVIRSDEEGRAIRVDDIATVRDDFVDDYIYYRHNTQPGAGLTILKSGDQDIVKMAEMVRAYVDARNGKPFEAKGIYERIMTSQLLPEEARRNFQTQMPSSRFTAWKLGSTSAAPLPPGAKIECNFDLARFVEGRLDLLVRNAMYGAVLVFATLLFFLNWRAAMWVGIGLTTALLGTLVLMSYLDITLNLLTMFGL
ncbi:MAG: efflux RND transporter permease subunit, partial [Rhodospirillales bacterium]|nr:efflux RND transporter permease subunit [Rhodospirillales bacterium]